MSAQPDGPQLVMRLTITHDGSTVCATDVHTRSEVRALLARHQPPAARGSVAQLLDPSLPRNHPRRVTTIATSVHSTRGPLWSPSAPEFLSLIIEPIA